MKSRIGALFLIAALTAVLISGCAGTGEPPVFPENTADNTNAYADIYDGTLDRYYSLIINGYNDEPVGDGEVGVLEITSYMDTQEALNAIGYAVRDLSGDGIPELIIASVSDNDGGTAYGDVIFAVYTIADGAPQLAFEGWARNRYSLLENGDIFNSGSNGAMYSIFGTYSLTEDGTGLVCSEYYFTYEKDQNFEEIGCYYNTTGEWDKEASEELQISMDEFWQIQDDFLNNIIRIELVPFASEDWKA